MNYAPRLKEQYRNEIAGNLQKQFGYKSVMQVPRLKKITLNQGVGAAVADKKMIESALTEMSMITGQKAVATKSKKDLNLFLMCVCWDCRTSVAIAPLLVSISPASSSFSEW